ncbi:MAG: hypothetical protein JXB15_13005 [Anaerolineales bacterium]|nr:hypothetical protein [Anaerolineales bacterium]
MSPAKQPAPLTEPTIQPSTAKEYIERGWILHARKEYPASEQDFRQAVALDGQSAEATYGLGLSLKMQKRMQEALQAFERTLNLLNMNVIKDDLIRAAMLRKLTEAHILLLQGEITQPVQRP